MSNSIGDLKNSGLQGNNWPWQYKVLLGLDKIVAAIGATEYEAQIIKATCPGPTPASGYYLEVRIYNPTTGTFGAPVYYLPGSTTPVNLSACTKEYANDSLVLTQIYTELLAQGLTLDAIETAVQGTLTVQANDLDIRPLTCTDVVSLCFDNAGTPTTVSNTNPLPVNATVTIPNPLPVSQDPTSTPWTIAGTVALDTATLTALETITVNQGTSPWVVSATALDIRPLTCATDSIKICEGGNDLGVGTDGSINVNLVDSINGTQAVVNPDGTQNNAIYGYDHTSLQNEQITSVGLSATVQALDVNIANSVPTLDVAIVNPLGVQGNCDNAVSTALCQTQEDILTDIKTAVEGTLDVNVVGTVGVTQSTSPWVVSTNSITRLPAILRVTGAGTIAPGARSFSILNAGSGIGSILGGVNNLLPGEEVDFAAGGNDVFGLINFNGNGVTTLVVTYVS